MRGCKRVLASRMHEIHALLAVDKPGGEYYKGGRGLLPTKSAFSSSAFSHMIFALRGERAELCPVNPIPLEVCYNMSQCPLYKLPDIFLIWATASAQSISSVDRASSAIEEGPGFKPQLGHHFSEISLHLGVRTMCTLSCMVQIS